MATSYRCKQDSPPQAAPPFLNSSKFIVGLSWGEIHPFYLFLGLCATSSCQGKGCKGSITPWPFITSFGNQALPQVPFQNSTFQAVSADGLWTRNLWMCGSSQKPSSPFPNPSGWRQNPGLRPAVPALSAKSEALFLKDKQNQKKIKAAVTFFF